MTNESLPNPPSYRWTIMTYLAGDNNLETYGRKDLHEVKVVGSTQEVALVAQFDCMTDQVTRRYYLTSDRTLEQDCIAQLPEVNTGDPEALVDFVLWACQAYPAERYALILWNHGAGWKDDDIYHMAQRQGIAGKITRGQIRGLASGKVSRALFATTVKRLVLETAQTERAILFDDSSADFLDNQGLRSALQRIVDHVGRPLDLLGFDACLMNMVEVAYQVRDLCSVMVGSQELEPGDGWPYDRILSTVAEDPAVPAMTLARRAVESYTSFYRTYHPGLPVTLSAVNLVDVEAIAERVGCLGHVLRTSLMDPQVLGLLFSALRSVQTFNDRDYIDLTHFCQLLAKADSYGKVGTAARRVTDLLHNERSPVFAEGHHGPGMTHACGLSIYLPIRILSPLYSQLEFARRCEWSAFLDALVQPC